MTLILELAPELEKRLNAEAGRQGLSPDAYALQLLGEAIPSEPMPTNGAELVQYWERHGLIGTRTDIADSQAHARHLRRNAENRDAA